MRKGVRGKETENHHQTEGALLMPGEEGFMLHKGFHSNRLLSKWKPLRTPQMGGTRWGAPDQCCLKWAPLAICMSVSQALVKKRVGPTPRFPEAGSLGMGPSNLHFKQPYKVWQSPPWGPYPEKVRIPCFLVPPPGLPTSSQEVTILVGRWYRVVGVPKIFINCSMVS